jgi:hypothetical protein
MSRAVKKALVDGRRGAGPRLQEMAEPPASGGTPSSGSGNDPHVND